MAYPLRKPPSFNWVLLPRDKYIAIQTRRQAGHTQYQLLIPTTSPNSQWCHFSTATKAATVGSSRQIEAPARVDKRAGGTYRSGYTVRAGCWSRCGTARICSVSRGWRISTHPAACFEILGSIGLRSAVFDCYYSTVMRPRRTTSHTPSPASQSHGEGEYCATRWIIVCFQRMYCTGVPVVPVFARLPELLLQAVADAFGERFSCVRCWDSQNWDVPEYLIQISIILREILTHSLTVTPSWQGDRITHIPRQQRTHRILPPTSHTTPQHTIQEHSYNPHRATRHHLRPQPSTSDHIPSRMTRYPTRRYLYPHRPRGHDPPPRVESTIRDPLVSASCASWSRLACTTTIAASPVPVPTTVRERCCTTAMSRDCLWIGIICTIACLAQCHVAGRGGRALSDVFLPSRFIFARPWLSEQRP